MCAWSVCMYKTVCLYICVSVYMSVCVICVCVYAVYAYVCMNVCIFVCLLSNHHFIFRVHSLCLQMFPHTKMTLKPNFDPLLEMEKKLKKIVHTVMWVRFRQINGYITI